MMWDVSNCDVAVIGAGPAGLAAATAAARAGLSVVVLDENPSPGGQIYRAVGATPVADKSVLGGDYWAGARLVDEFKLSGAVYISGATVWLVTREREVGYSIAGRARRLRANRIIIATGALERPFSIPGWTLPGVMTAGGAQTLLKASGIVPEGRVVLAGCGPLLWLLASQYLRAGANIEAMLDTTCAANWRAALTHFPGFATSPYFRKGLTFVRHVRSKVRLIKGVTELAAEGEDRLRRVRYTASGKASTIEADYLLLHQGVVPNTNLANSIGIPHHWDDVQLCFLPVAESDGTTGIEGIAIAGDGAGIGGAEAAEASGQVAANAAIRALAPNSSELANAEHAHRRLRRASRGRAFLDRAYQPASQFRIPSGDTIVCRCEEVTAAEIVRTAAMGVPGPNQMKAFLRCGMGPCQGRLCGLTVTEIIAKARSVSPQDVGYYRLRPPIKPITVGELAAWPQDEAAINAVARG